MQNQKTKKKNNENEHTTIGARLTRAKFLFFGKRLKRTSSEPPTTIHNYP